MKTAGIALIRGYRYIASPWVGNQCRFYPTCSHYAEEAIQHHGLFKGCILTAKRLLKCHPFHPGGIDFVPGTDPQAHTDHLDTDRLHTDNQQRQQL